MNELKHFGNSMFGPEKDCCSSCGNEVSTSTMRNGVCTDCINSGMTLTLKRPINKFFAVIGFLVVFIELIFNLCTLGLYMMLLNRLKLGTFGVWFLFQIFRREHPDLKYKQFKD